MKTNSILFVGLVIMLMASCSPKISTSIVKRYPPSDLQEEILVLGVYDPQPEKAEFLGIVKVGNTMTSTNCDFVVVLSKTMAEVRKIGGNVLKLTQDIPNGNGCHQIIANILKVEDIDDIRPATIPSNANYALLHLYRPNGSGGLNYDLHLDKNIITRSNNNWRESVKIENEGFYNLWARTEQTSSLPLNIKFGNEYYVRSSVTQGTFIGRPQLTLMDNKFGRVEYQSVTTKTNFSTFSLRDTTNNLMTVTAPRFRFSINAGFSYRTASIPDDLNPTARAYYNKLKLGFQYDLGVSYFWSEWLGVGFKYNEARMSNEFEGWITPPGGTSQSGKLSDNIRINFIGPVLNYRMYGRQQQKKNCFLFDFGLGYAGYQDKGTILSEHITITGSTAGVYLGLGYDLWLSATTSLGFQIELTGASLSEYTVTDGVNTGTVKLDPGQYEGLGRIGFSIGLRF